MLKQVMDAYPKQVRFVYKHYPLPMHPNARPASEAAMFAKKHGKFWEMHEMIFQNFSQLGMDKYKAFAKQLGLDEGALEASITGQAFKAEIDKDVQDGQKAAVTGTPSIFVNGKRLQNRSFEGFKQMIDVILKEKGAQPAAK